MRGGGDRLYSFSNTKLKSFRGIKRTADFALKGGYHKVSHLMSHRKGMSGNLSQLSWETNLRSLGRRKQDTGKNTKLKSLEASFRT